MIIFDFDGTIADSLEALIAASNRLAREFNYTEISYSQVRQLQTLSSRQIIQQSKIPLFKVPFLMKRLRTEMGHEIKTIKPIYGIEKALAQLKSLGYPLGIVTSNSTENVAAFLSHYHLTGIFDFTHSAATLFGKHRILKRLMRERRLDPASTIYVGDETRDIESAKRLPISVIAVSWGYNSKEILQKHNPDSLIQNPSELALAVRRLGQRP
ncbi:MAG: HAD hydrolase-like protein [Elainellaceae cyanobacterium]